jgi:hypothetical protein
MVYFEDKSRDFNICSSKLRRCLIEFYIWRVSDLCVRMLVEIINIKKIRVSTL